MTGKLRVKTGVVVVIFLLSPLVVVGFLWQTSDLCPGMSDSSSSAFSCQSSLPSKACYDLVGWGMEMHVRRPYPTDASDEWAIVVPSLTLMPPDAPRRCHDPRTVKLPAATHGFGPLTRWWVVERRVAFARLIRHRLVTTIAHGPFHAWDYWQAQWSLWPSFHIQAVARAFHLG